MKTCSLTRSRALAQLCILVIGAILAAVTGPAGAQQRLPQQLGTVTGAAPQAQPVAVPPFVVTGGQKYERDVISTTILNDLRLSGFFTESRNPAFVTQQHTRDLRDDTIHFADWTRINVDYLIRGDYQVVGDQIEAEVRTYSVVDGRYIFGTRYNQYPSNQPERLAHRIADDVFQRIVDEPGIASTKLAFVRQTGAVSGKQIKEIFVMDADGSNVKQVTNDRDLAATPAWGARAGEIYYMTYRDYNSDLAGILLDASRYTWFIARFPGLNVSPQWGPKRQRIVMTLTKDGNPEIYTLTREGGDVKRLTYSPRSIESTPSWSPSEDQIAFTSNRSGSKQIWIMDDTGVNVRRLTNFGDYNDGAMWSPRGDRLAFASRINGFFQIFTISPSGEDLLQLTNGNYNNEEPTWAPNGWVLAYSSDRSGVKQIHTMFADGSPLAQLTNARGDSFSPAWSPLLP